LGNRGFPAILRDHGYATRFFSAADPAWDGQVPWLRQWYGQIDYDRGRETDEAMFAHMARWMRDSLDASRPFMLGAITKTNHYPFNPEPGVRAVPGDASLQEKMLATMAYTDAAMGRFLDVLRGEPWFPRTVFIILADHGFPLSEHGSSTIGHGLYNESVWIPFVMAGKHPELGSAAFRHYPASQLDIGPTVLDLAGIRAANHFLGHSLVRPATGVHSLSYLVRGQQGTLEHGDHRIHGPLGEIPREQGPEVFHTVSDKLEAKNLLPEAQAIFDSLMPVLKGVARLNTWLIEADALWPDSTDRSAWLGPRPESENRPLFLAIPAD
jgi:phosphoglycerol transferase MdoB-like AlkP superfamily enzyme